MTQQPVNWERLAGKVIDRRNSLLMTQADVEAAGGPSTATLRLIEGARQTSYRRQVLMRLETALQWAPGSIDRVLAGGDPTDITPSVKHPTSTATVRLREQVADEIKRVLDDPELTPEERIQLAEILMDAWEREEEKARRERVARAKETVETWKRARSA